MVVKAANINDVIDELKSAGVWVYAADMDGKSVYSTNLKGAVAFVIGEKARV